MKSLSHHYFLVFLLFLPGNTLTEIVDFEEENMPEQITATLPRDIYDPKKEWNLSSLYKFTGKVAFATTVVVGVAALGAATGGAVFAIPAAGGIGSGPGVIASLKIGGALGGFFGIGVGTNMAKKEFDSDNPSPEAQAASVLGGIILTTTLLTPITGLPSLTSPVLEEGTKILGLQASVLMSPTAKLGSFGVGLAMDKLRSNNEKKKL